MRAEGAKLVQPEDGRTKGRLIAVFIYPVGRRRQSQTLLRLTAKGQEAAVTSSSKDIPARWKDTSVDRGSG